MGAAVSRDHAKLPFGYTHARKDHSFSASSVSRRKLATRLLRTSDTTSVTPFPIQDTTTALPSISNPSPETTTTAIVSYSNSSSLSPLLVLPPATLNALSTSSRTNWTTTPTASSPIGTNNSDTSTSHNNSLLQSSTTTFFVPESGTGTSAIPGFSESGHSQHSTRSTSNTPAVVAAAGSHFQHNQHQITVTASCSEHNNSDNNNNNNSSATLTTSSGSSVAWTNTTHNAPAAMTNPDLVAHAATSSSSTSALLKGTTAPTRTTSRLGEAAAESCSSASPLQKQRLSQSMRTQEEQDNDMDIISALEIADVKAAPYDFFSSSSTNNSNSNNNNNDSSSNSSNNNKNNNTIELPSRHHPHSHHTHSHHGHGSTSCQHPPISTNLDALVSVPPVLGESRLEQDDESQQASRTFPGPDRWIHYISDTTLDAFDEEQQRKRYQQQDEVNMELDMGEEGMVKLEGDADESDSILGVELGHLSPIPFSELPSMTSIGLCSRGIVRLSSNIKLLASATCVQIIPMEIGFLRNLTLLDLSKNCLKSLPESIIHLSKLVELKLSFNQLETIPSGIGGLTKLASLTLDNNRITSIPSQIGLIKDLVNLDLSDNPIKVLPAEVGKLQFLRRLKLERCPLVEEFVHSPVHSPPTLLELAARVIARYDIQMPPLMLPHLKAYVDSAQSCTFCDGPYFDSWVKRGKLIEKNEMFIPLEYTLCQPHWNTEMERVKLLFCPRPITSPRPKLATTPTPHGAQRNNSNNSSKNSDSATIPVRRQTIRSTSASTTASGSSKAPVLFSADSYGSTASSASTVNSPAMSSSSPTMTSDSGSEQQQMLQRVRPTLGHRLSMLLKPKRERPLSAFMISTPSSASSSSASSPSLASSPMMGGEEMPSTTTRPSTLSRASTGLFGRTGIKGSRRPLSMLVGGSASSPLINSSPAVMTLSNLSASR
ncbi:hypothetical protein BGZ47_008499 [Haplosporangium gracile]|nr:hypothetical protein BGZ47_008499 [Haplosporangium gracile]